MHGGQGALSARVREGDGRPVSGMTSAVQTPGQGPSRLLPPAILPTQPSVPRHTPPPRACTPVCPAGRARTQPASAHRDRRPQPPGHRRHRSRDACPTLGPGGTAPPSCLHPHPHLGLPRRDKSPPERLSPPHLLVPRPNHHGRSPGTAGSKRQAVGVAPEGSQPREWGAGTEGSRVTIPAPCPAHPGSLSPTSLSQIRSKSRGAPGPVGSRG